MLVSKYDREDYIRVTLWELIIYVVYIIVTCISTSHVTLFVLFFRIRCVCYENKFLTFPFIVPVF